MSRRRIDTVVLGGALALTEAMHRRVGEAERRQTERREADRRTSEARIAAERAAAVPPAAPAPSPSIPGMPLPTGYGLQVRGPQGESIVLPVCLPPGFELDSMMLCPEFLPPRAEAGSAPAAPSFAPPRTTSPAAPAPVAPAAPTRPAAPPARPARPDTGASPGRLDGVLQLVFGADQRFSSSLEHSNEDTQTSEPARGSPGVPESARS